MEKQPNVQADFWDRRAASFPRYDPAPDGYEVQILQAARELGVDFRGKTVLDVGCGSGMYTLRLAQEAARVTAVDVSERMLEISRRDAGALGLTNIDYQQADWGEHELAGRSDVVFCSMCPAVKDDEGKKKLLAAVGEVLVFVGFARWTDPEPVKSLLERWRLTPKRFESGPEMRQWLTAQKLSFVWRAKSGVWFKRLQLEEAVEWCSTILSDCGLKEPERAVIVEHLAPCRVPGVEDYLIETPYSVELIVWRRT
ncbi:MAG: class I SAM-dependent methyltransferase [Deltaproteobacteria bacterium]|jgi:SAM-dependent methyltransferase|nr:class I SAM-dependent methyltransferase [Deltaproteobacteria bacterium]